MTFAEMKALLETILQENLSASTAQQIITTAEAETLLNLGVLEIARVADPTILVDIQAESTLTSTSEAFPSDMLRPVAYEIDGMMYKPLSPADPEYGNSFPGRSSFSSSVRAWGRITLPTTPTSGKFYYIKKPATMSADLDVPDLPPQLHPAAVYYAAWLASVKDKNEETSLLTMAYTIAGVNAGGGE